jgi:uncharacterized protein YcbK (DUF882 family)
MIQKSEVLMGRDKSHAKEYTDEISKNIDKLLIPLNKLRKAYGKIMVVSSGWRPVTLNAKTANAAKKSNHVKGLACDFQDKDGKLDEWCMQNLNKLKEFGLWLEDPGSTPGWCHLQCLPPKSGNNPFKP